MTGWRLTVRTSFSPLSAVGKHVCVCACVCVCVFVCLCVLCVCVTPFIGLKSLYSQSENEHTTGMAGMTASQSNEALRSNDWKCQPGDSMKAIIQHRLAW